MKKRVLIVLVAGLGGYAAYRLLKPKPALDLDVLMEKFEERREKVEAMAGEFDPSALPEWFTTQLAYLDRMREVIESSAGDCEATARAIEALAKEYKRSTSQLDREAIKRDLVATRPGQRNKLAAQMAVASFRALDRLLPSFKTFAEECPEESRVFAFLR